MCLNVVFISVHISYVMFTTNTILFIDRVKISADSLRVALIWLSNAQIYNVDRKQVTTFLSSISSELCFCCNVHESCMSYHASAVTSVCRSAVLLDVWRLFLDVLSEVWSSRLAAISVSIPCWIRASRQLLCWWHLYYEMIFILSHGRAVGILMTNGSIKCATVQEEMFHNSCLLF